MPVLERLEPELRADEMLGNRGRWLSVHQGFGICSLAAVEEMEDEGQEEKKTESKAQ